MPMDRINLKTGMVIRQRLNRWSTEEIQAYIDYHHQLDQEAEVEEELYSDFSSCTIGRSRAIGIARIQEDARKYRFVDGDLGDDFDQRLQAAIRAVKAGE